jgi:hypothetical protein
MDYWGVCFKQGWEYLAQTHPNPSTPIRVQVNIPPGATNVEILPAQIRKHFQVVPADEEADYYMTNFRYRTTDLEKYPHEVYSISVNHSRILSIFKLR